MVGSRLSSQIVANQPRRSLDQLQTFRIGQVPQLFQEFCRDREWDCELEEGPDFESSRVFLVEYQRSDDYDTLDEELNDLAWVFADYLKQKYGEDDPRSEKP